MKKLRFFSSSSKRKIETQSSEIADETEQGIHAIKDFFADGNSGNDEDESKNCCNIWDKTFKSVNFLKIHDTKYHIKNGSQNIYNCDNCNCDNWELVPPKKMGNENCDGAAEHYL